MHVTMHDANMKHFARICSDVSQRFGVCHLALFTDCALALDPLRDRICALQKLCMRDRKRSEKVVSAAPTLILELDASGVKAAWL